MAAKVVVERSIALNTSDEPVSKTWIEEKRWSTFKEARNQKSGKLSNSKAVQRRRLSELTKQEKTVHSKVPLELLARDWLNEQRANPEMRSYLVETLLPSLVIGLEKLLTEVSIRGLSEDKEEDPDFNPLNYLAQHLMRNNPRYSNFAEAHPYCRTMRQVSEELKKMAYSIDDNKLAQIKSDVKKRRMERESQESAKALEVGRREGLLKAVYNKWILPSEEGLVLSNVQLAIQSWLDLMSEHPMISTVQGLFSKLLSSEGGVVSSECDLVSSIMEVGSEFPSDLFDSLAKHLSVCGEERRRMRQREQRGALFGSVFKDCDPDKTGAVDRLRVLHLFNCFYDSAASDIQDKLHNPRKWPIVEVAEMEELEEDEERRASSITESSLSDQEYQEFLNETVGEVDNPSRRDPESQGDPPKDTPNGDDVESKEVNDKKEDPSEDDKESNETQPASPEAEAKDQIESSVKVEDTPPDPPRDTTEDLKSANEEEPKPSPCSGSVLERRLTKASHYGRSASISAMRRLSGMSSRPVSPSGPGSAWDHFLLNCSQFVQLVEIFLSSDSMDSTVDTLSSFIRDSYTETAQERAERLELAQQQMEALTRRQRVNSMFEMWDSDHSGYLELEELQLVLSKWKGFGTEQTQEQAKEIPSSLGAQQTRLSLVSFQTYIKELTEGMQLEAFDEFSEYLMTCVKLTVEEQRRGEKRKVLLDKISQAGRASGLQFLQGMKAAISAVHEDTLEYGGGKTCSVSIALLEPTSSSDPNLCLSYKAATDDTATRVVGHKLLRSFTQGVSFMAVDSGRPVCVQDIQSHGGVYLFVPEHNKEEFNGSLVVSPITTPGEAVVGTFSVDTIGKVTEDSLDTSFLTHEINFYQGIGVCLGELFHWIDSRRKLLKVSQSALSWVHRRCPQVTQTDVYLVEPSKGGPSKCPYTLRCMLSTTGADNRTTENKSLEREENMFCDYLFQCADNSEPVLANACGQHHLAYPIRDSTGCAVAVVDFHMPPTQHLRPHQLKEVTKVLKLLTQAYYQLSRIPDTGKGNILDTVASSRPVTQDSDRDISVLFDQLMLTDLKERMAKLDKRVFAELRSYVVPPPVVLGIVQALLYILYPDREFDTWTKCKQSVTLSLVKALETYDPLNLEEKEHKRLDQVSNILKGIQVGSIQDQGSLPAKYIYSWVNVCLSLLEHAATMPPVTPANTSSTKTPLNNGEAEKDVKEARIKSGNMEGSSSVENSSPTD